MEGLKTNLDADQAHLKRVIIRRGPLATLAGLIRLAVGDPRQPEAETCERQLAAMG